MEIAIVLLAIAVLFIIKTVKVVPQQNAWVVERLGKYHASLTPGLNFVVPFIDKVIQKHHVEGENYSQYKEIQRVKHNFLAVLWIV